MFQIEVTGGTFQHREFLEINERLSFLRSVDVRYMYIHFHYHWNDEKKESLRVAPKLHHDIFNVLFISVAVNNSRDFNGQVIYGFLPNLRVHQKVRCQFPDEVNHAFVEFFACQEEALDISIDVSESERCLRLRSAGFLYEDCQSVEMTSQSLLDVLKT